MRRSALLLTSTFAMGATGLLGASVASAAPNAATVSCSAGSTFAVDARGSVDAATQGAVSDVLTGRGLTPSGAGADVTVVIAPADQLSPTGDPSTLAAAFVDDGASVPADGADVAHAALGGDTAAFAGLVDATCGTSPQDTTADEADESTGDEAGSTEDDTAAAAATTDAQTATEESSAAQEAASQDGAAEAEASDEAAAPVADEVAAAQSAPAAANDKNCEDFSSQPEAQAHLDGQVGDPDVLDRDNDGLACDDYDYGSTGTEASDASGSSVTVAAASDDDSADVTVGASADDKDCADFATQAEAQTFFTSNGGPASDSHRLDADDDGIACEDHAYDSSPRTDPVYIDSGAPTGTTDVAGLTAGGLLVAAGAALGLRARRRA
ncbi:hypothetical protein GCM10027055_02890 [Janibacter alkaliphilus]|uniref:Excalibur calcium-binding domain-containing protein n=1 Tax=Janibacter alkaliphilus TaxID=1069963 RepID=A0A852X988_9MICO|nr:excalibur calcium-binding domain-containing protein [Janibacter alkaliphilus]NYG36904.1 hypothetical protein [Janibacter alkaliphilus]